MISLHGLIVLAEAESSSSGVSDAIPSIKDKLIPSWLSFVVQLSALLVLITVVIIFAYKPIKKMLAKRADYIESQIADAEKDKALAKENAIKSEEMIIASRKKADEIIETANIKAEENYNQKIEETRLEILNMKADAEKDIERSRKDALDEIHNEMVDVALLTSSEILKRNVNNQDNERLAKEFIEKL